LATSYEILAPDRVRFTLRKGVQFHDGTPFNAQAVKYTFDRALSMPARWKSLFGPLKSTDVVDDYTVDVTTETPYGPILASVSMCYAGIISPTAVEKYGQDYGRHPVGTGPFMFKEWKTKDHITIVRNDNYWGEKAYLDEVVFKVIPEHGARMMGLRTGDFDMVIKPSPSELPIFRKDSNFTVAEAMGMRVFFTGFHCDLFPTNEVKIRQALSMAVDVKGIVDNILEGAAVIPKGYLAPAVFGFKDMQLQKRYPYDPAKAKTLLAEAGWKDTDGDGFLDKDGKKMTLRFLGAKGRYMMDAECCEAIQAQFKEIGVDAQLDFFEWAATFSILRKPKLDYNMYSVGWVTTNADADYSLYAMFHSGQMLPKGWNFNRVSDPTIDKLLDEARSTLDREKRKANYAQVQEILAESAPWIPIYNTKETFVLNKNVKGFVPDALEYQLTLSGVWLDR
jgi:peptide/nickel transport system substrate-binding protein